MYATAADYRTLCADGRIPEELVEAYLRDAEQDIDSLTYGRVARAGFSALTQHQRALITRAVCWQAAFRYDYAELFTSPLSAYAINGVSMSFGGTNTVERGGVVTLLAVDALLRRTGLAFRGVS